MLLRRLTLHVKAQNWFAVGIDFVIVVVGVFIGIQVANWNDSRAFKARELELLVELKSEIEDAIQLSNNRGHGYAQAAAAGKRTLLFLASDTPCDSDCWPVLVDFMHASQWQGMSIPRTTYDEMRRLGLPSARSIVEAVEAFYAQNQQIVQAMIDKPAYRSLVRQMIPVEAQESYWTNCHQLIDGYESYALDCPRGVSADVAKSAVTTIINHPQIQLSLTEWAGDVTAVPGDLDAQVRAGERAMAAIDNVLVAHN
jgi:hypothetical protein